MKPLVSIIIPCYNYGRFLGESIESALAQTYAPIEIIVVNDGSTDNTREVASRYPVKFIDQKNQGAARTFNSGIHEASGKYVVILSADDRFDPSYVEKTVTVLEDNPSLMFAYTHTILFGAKSGIMKSKEFSVDTLRLANYITGTTLMKKEAFRVVKGFDPELTCLEDWDMWLTFAENGFYGKLLPEALFHYRIHATTSRNIVTMKTLFMTTLQIWRRHPKICPSSFIVHTVVIAALYALLRFALLPLELLSPQRLSEKISSTREKLVYRRGAEIVDLSEGAGAA